MAYLFSFLLFTELDKQVSVLVNDYSIVWEPTDTFIIESNCLLKLKVICSLFRMLYQFKVCQLACFS